LDAATLLRLERTTKLGRLGEQLAEERLIAAGFIDVRNLNQAANFPYADIVATKNNQVFLIGVKARNELCDVGKLGLHPVRLTPA
jgi:Holliday junction resolvase